MGILDQAIGWLSPEWKLKRDVAREQSKLFADSGNSTDNGSYYGPYSGAISTRVSSPWFISPTNLEFRYISAVGLRNMRNRARTLERNNELAAAMLSRTVENVVGPKGFQLQCTSNNPAWTPEHNAQWNKQAETLMKAWYPAADISGLSWVEHQKLVLRSMLRDGDVAVVLDKDGYLMGIEGDLIQDPDKETKDKVNATIHFGIEIDEYLKPVGFWINSLPTNDDTGEGKDTVSSRFDAKDVIFVANINRFGQLRGETIFATIFDLIDQISKWKDATLMAARVAACFGVAITKKNKAQIFGANNANTNANGVAQAAINLEPGAIQYLDPGDSIETINPAQPGHNFPANLTAMIRLAGLPFGLPIELTLNDYSKGSYISSRAALQQAYRKTQSFQQFFIDRYLKRVYQWRISKFVKAGLLEPNPDAWNHRWICQPWPYLDPVKELQAIQMSFDTGTSTLTAQLQAEGRTLSDYIAERKAELDALKEAGIPQLHSQALLQYTTGTPPAAGKVQTDPTVEPSEASDEPDDDEIPTDDTGENDNA